MLDFASALYLGLRHANPPLTGWHALTFGRPAALQEPTGALETSETLARMQGCEQALLMPSTLHLFFDLFDMLSREPVTLLVDSCAYPITRWAMRTARARGCFVSVFDGRDLASVSVLAARAVAAGRRNVLVTDGFCCVCGRSPPIRDYAELVETFDGLLIIDDTQGIGMLGSRPDATMPYGYGGGGALRWHGASSNRIIIGASLAKAFGAPLAVISGSEPLIHRFREMSATRVHCSPPSFAAIAAAKAALRINEQCGDVLRARLHERVKQLQDVMTRAGLSCRVAFPFPVQHFSVPAHVDAPDFGRLLRRFGLWAVPTRSKRGISLTFMVSVRHRPCDIEAAGRIVADLLSTNAAFGRREYRNEQTIV